MKIGWIDVLKERYGETIYSDRVQSILSKHHDLERINVGPEHFEKYHYPKMLYPSYGAVLKRMLAMLQSSSNQ